MDTVITKGGATSIPLDIRARYQLQPGDRLIWLDDGNAIRLHPQLLDQRSCIPGVKGTGVFFAAKHAGKK